MAEITNWPIIIDYTSNFTTADPVLGIAPITPNVNDPAMLSLTNHYDLGNPIVIFWTTTATVDTVYSNMAVRVFSCAKSLFDILYTDLGTLYLEVYVCANHPIIVLNPNPVVLDNSALPNFN